MISTAVPPFFLSWVYLLTNYDFFVTVAPEYLFVVTERVTATRTGQRPRIIISNVYRSPSTRTRSRNSILYMAMIQYHIQDCLIGGIEWSRITIIRLSECNYIHQMLRTIFMTVWQCQHPFPLTRFAFS